MLYRMDRLSAYSKHVSLGYSCSTATLTYYHNHSTVDFNM
eukprot:COSAG05_NODE_2324_length_3235_cov_2.008610_2_plen_40_part_00